MLRTWETEALNYHRTHATNRPREAINLLIENTRRLTRPQTGLSRVEPLF